MSQEQQIDSSNCGSLFPTFHVSLGDAFVPGLLTFGNFFRNGACLAWTSGSGLVYIHGAMDDQQGRSKLSIDVNQSIVALTTGALDGCECLVIAHLQALQCYDVFENKQIFYVEVENTIESVISIPGKAMDSSMIVIGSQCIIQGFDLRGKEVLWTMTPDRVSSIATLATKAPVLLIGTDGFEISCFEIETSSKKWSVQEADVVEFLINLGDERFGYGLRNGTIGVYSGTTRLWRVKSKHRVQCLAPIQIGEHTYFVSGWSNGKFEARKIENGEILCRESVSAPIVGIFSNDFRRCDNEDIVICTSQGFIRGYNTTLSEHSRLRHEIASKQSTITLLNQKLKELHFELESLEVARHRIGNEAELNARKHTEMDISQSIQFQLEPNFETNCVVLQVTSHRDQYLFKGGIALGENLFENEAEFVVYKTPRDKLELSLAPKKDVKTEVCLQVFVKHKTSSNYYVIDIYQKIPRFVMFAPKKHSMSNKIESYALFTLHESISTVKSWKEDRFLPHNDSHDDHINSYVCLRSNNAIELTLEQLDHNQKSGTKMMVRCDDIEIVGAILQDLCQEFGVQELQPLIYFPYVMQELKHNLKKLDNYDCNGLESSTTIAKILPQMKSLMVQSEDHRLMRDQASLRSCYCELNGLNQDLMSHHERRVHSREIHSQALQQVGRQIQSIAHLYRGSFKNKLLQDCRESLKARKIHSILELMEQLQHNTNT